ncbi:hypothetical protein [Pseudomonas sp. NPDC007930]|uniref:hypothetical protein n=1 Tax=Pseudomonas sp. NPDC007930 TaxID=3364417 RepID=UPI0036E40051
MSVLSVYPENSPELPNKVLGHLEDILATLPGSVRLEQSPGQRLARGASADEVLAACAGHLPSGARVLAAEQLAAWAEAQQFAVQQQLYVAAGEGVVWVRHDGYHYALACGRGDKVSLAPGTVHWLEADEPREWVVLWAGAPL